MSDEKDVDLKAEIDRWTRVFEQPAHAIVIDDGAAERLALVLMKAASEIARLSSTRRDIVAAADPMWTKDMKTGQRVVALHLTTTDGQTLVLALPADLAKRLLIGSFPLNWSPTPLG